VKMCRYTCRDKQRPLRVEQKQRWSRGELDLLAEDATQHRTIKELGKERSQREEKLSKAEASNDGSHECSKRHKPMKQSQFAKTGKLSCTATVEVVFVGCVGCAYGQRKDGVGVSESPSWLGDVQAIPRWHVGKQQPEPDNLSNSSLAAV
jgi:hypothetical protein